MNHRRGFTENTTKILIWVLIFILGLAAVYFMFKRLGLS